MFNIYIHDYCMKRGYERTANTLREEASIQEDPQPPINAKQGLLFEWWSVFWVLFSAKSSGSGPEDAMVYTHYQTQQTANRQTQAARAPQPMQGLSRFANGPAGPRQGGQMPNGVPTPGQPGQPPIPNGISHYQANGAPATNGPTMGTPSQQPMILTQRPGQAPGAGQLRGPNGAPFQSPTMAQQVAGGPPGAHMTGPMNASQPPRMPMPPPNTPGMGGQQQQQQQQHQQAPFQHLGSQPGSPAQNNLTAPSPRQMPRQTLPEIRQLQETELNQAIMKINPTRLAEIKAEAGCGNKDLPSMTLEDKHGVIEIARARNLLQPFTRNAQPLAPNAAAGPSNMQMPPPGQRPGMNQPPLSQQGMQQRNAKRSSASPGDDKDQSQNESSPPAPKRLRPSPANEHAQPPMAPILPFPSSQPGVPGMQHAMRPMTGPPFQQQGLPHMNMQHGMNAQHISPQMVGMTPQMQQYRQSMHQLHKQQGGMMMPGNVPSPASADSPFNGDGSQSRPNTGQFGGPPGQGQVQGGMAAQNRPPGPPGPPPSKMMPPPQSPGMSHTKNPNPPKDGHPDGSGVGSSPRNAPQPGQQGQSMAGPQGQPGQPGPQGPNRSPGGPMNSMGGSNTAPPIPAPPAPGNVPAPPTTQPLSQGPQAPPSQEIFDPGYLDMGLFNDMNFDAGIGGMDFGDSMSSEFSNTWDFNL